MTAALTIRGVDLVGALGFNFTDEGQIFDAAMSTQTELEIPNLPGALLMGPYRTPIRAWTIKGYLSGASQAAVLANLKTLQAIVGDGALIPIIIGNRPTMQLMAYCSSMAGLTYPVAATGNRSNALNEIPIAVEMPFRGGPYWQDITPQAIAFTTGAVSMPQGTADSEPVLTTDATAAAADLLTCKDSSGNTLWTTTLAARATGEKYRITTARGVMTIEKFTGGIWTNSDASLTAGIFPRAMRSTGDMYLASAWDTMQSTHGNWTATYPMRWR